MNDEKRDAQFYRDTESIAFAKLDDRQLALLEPLGARRVLRKGEMLFKAGQRELDMTVVITGEIEVFESCDGLEQIPGTGEPGDFMGDVAMLNGTSAVASARCRAEESEILEVPAAALRKALAELPGLGETIINAFIMRRERLERDGNVVDVRGPTCFRLVLFNDTSHYSQEAGELATMPGNRLSPHWSAPNP